MPNPLEESCAPKPRCAASRTCSPRTFFNAYYDSFCHMPLKVFEGYLGEMILPLLHWVWNILSKASNRHSFPNSYCLSPNMVVIGIIRRKLEKK